MSGKWHDVAGIEIIEEERVAVSVHHLLPAEFVSLLNGKKTTPRIKPTPGNHLEEVEVIHFIEEDGIWKVKDPGGDKFRWR